MLDLDGYKSVIILSLITILFASPFTTAISHINLISRRFYRLFCWYCSLLALPGSLLSKVRLYTKCANLLFLDWISEQPWLSHTQGGERNYFTVGWFSDYKVNTEEAVLPLLVAVVIHSVQKGKKELILHTPFSYSTRKSFYKDNGQNGTSLQWVLVPVMKS